MEWLYVASLTVAGLVAAARFGLARRHQRPYNLLSLIATVLVVAPFAANVFIWPAHHPRNYLHRNCFANMREMYVSIQLYAYDNDDRMPVRQPLTTIKKYNETSLPGCLADEEVRYGLNAALLGQSPEKFIEREGILMAAETRRTDELVERDADIALPHKGRGTACMTNGTVQFLPLRSTATRGPFWRESVPVRVPPVPPNRLAFLGTLWNRIAFPIFFAGLPISLVGFFRVPKESPRRQFWRWAIWIWAALFALGLAMPVFV